MSTGCKPGCHEDRGTGVMWHQPDCRNAVRIAPAAAPVESEGEHDRLIERLLIMKMEAYSAQDPESGETLAEAIEALRSQESEPSGAVGYVVVAHGANGEVRIVRGNTWPLDLQWARGECAEYNERFGDYHSVARVTPLTEDEGA